MNLLTEIWRTPGMSIQGRTLHRTAVRGVVLRGRNLLMVHSAAVGDYKFPGGGVGPGESLVQALQREVREECGAAVLRVGREIGAVVEYDLPVEEAYDVFKMTSHYLYCDVADGFGVQMLDDYERDLGFTPVWIDIDEALRLNQALLLADKTPEWLLRETFVLDYVRKKLLAPPGS